MSDLGTADSNDISFPSAKFLYLQNFMLPFVYIVHSRSIILLSTSFRSRLGCQIIVTKAFEGITLRVPKAHRDVRDL